MHAQIITVPVNSACGSDTCACNQSYVCRCNASMCARAPVLTHSAGAAARQAPVSAATSRKSTAVLGTQRRPIHHASIIVISTSPLYPFTLNRRHKQCVPCHDPRSIPFIYCPSCLVLLLPLNHLSIIYIHAPSTHTGGAPWRNIRYATNEGVFTYQKCSVVFHRVPP